MPLPANWLEELVIEWLDLEGFVISTSVFATALAGGRAMADVVGAKLDEKGCLLIRHCEAAMTLIDNPKKVAERYASTKFSPAIEKAARTRFGAIFGAPASKQAVYEKWVIGLFASDNIQNELRARIPNVKIYLLRNFLLEIVLPAIKRWRTEPPNKSTTTLPPDKWLLDLIDRFNHFDLIKLAA